MVDSSMDAREWARKQLEEADPDLLRALMQTVLEDLMGTEIDQICGASYGERSEIRENSRNGYRSRRFDTRVGTMDLPIPKLRSGSYFPDWLLERQRRAEKALISIVADAYLAGVSTRRVDKLVKQLGIEGISKSQVSKLAASLDDINGASGGVGTFAVQIAKSFGAEVTGVCSTRNVDMVQSIGADQVIDYTQDDFTKSGQRYDLILDNGDRSLSDCRHALTRKGTLVVIGGLAGRWIDGLGRANKARVLSPFVSQRLHPFLTRWSKQDLHVVKDLIEAGKVTPVIDRTHPLSEAPEAIRHLEGGHARGKIVITVLGQGLVLRIIKSFHCRAGTNESQ